MFRLQPPIYMFLKEQLLLVMVPYLAMVNGGQRIRLRHPTGIHRAAQSLSRRQSLQKPVSRQSLGTR